ncbi:MAG: hypothetical protein FH753_13275 [Firmicutes bacterium]|nr:hypothetical protein [Bacillota bacterium]
MIKMLEGFTAFELLKLFAPLIIFELTLKVFCIVKIIKDGVRNLSIPIWLIIIVLLSTFGPVSFLLCGRRRKYD